MANYGWRLLVVCVYGRTIRAGRFARPTRRRMTCVKRTSGAFWKTNMVISGPVRGVVQSEFRAPGFQIIPAPTVWETGLSIRFSKTTAVNCLSALPRTPAALSAVLTGTNSWPSIRNCPGMLIILAGVGSRQYGRIKPAHGGSRRVPDFFARRLELQLKISGARHHN